MSQIKKAKLKEGQKLYWIRRIKEFPFGELKFCYVKAIKEPAVCILHAGEDGELPEFRRDDNGQTISLGFFGGVLDELYTNNPDLGYFFGDSAYSTLVKASGYYENECHNLQTELEKLIPIRDGMSKLYMDFMVKKHS